MNTELNNNVRLAPVTGTVYGRITLTSGGAVIHSLSGPEAVDRAQVTATRTAAGIVSIVIGNFRGPQGYSFAFGTGVTDGHIVNAALGTYSGNTLTTVFTVNSDAGTDTDANFTFQIVAS